MFSHLRQHFLRFVLVWYCVVGPAGLVAAVLGGIRELADHTWVGHLPADRQVQR